MTVPTLGVEYRAKMINLQGKSVKLQLWDTTGHEAAFKSMTRSFYRGAAGALVVYDITKKDTFTGVKKWLGNARENGNPNMTFMIVGNKADLESERQVQTLEGEQLAKENKVIFIETSAKSSLNVEEAFLRTASIIFDKIKTGEIDPKGQNSGVKITGETPDDIINIGKSKPIQQDKDKGCSC